MGAITVGFVPIYFYFHLYIYTLYKRVLYKVKTQTQVFKTIKSLQRNNHNKQINE